MSKYKKYIDRATNEEVKARFDRGDYFIQSKSGYFMLSYKDFWKKYKDPSGGTSSYEILHNNKLLSETK